MIKYALGINPTINTLIGLPVVAPSADHLTLTFTRPLAASDVSYTVQVSGDLAAWDDGSRYSASGDVPSNSFTTQLSRTTSGANETIVVQDNSTVSGNPRRYMRLKVRRP